MTAFSASQAWMLWLSIGLLLITPGPTNTLLASAGCQRGMRWAAPLTLAELGGYLVAIAVWGCIVVRMSERFAWLPNLLRVASALYLLMLAWRMWRTHERTHDVANMRGLFIATLLNPKAMLFAGTIFPAAAFVDFHAYVYTIAVFASALMPIGFLWIAWARRLAKDTLHGLRRRACNAAVRSCFACLRWRYRAEFSFDACSSTV